MAITDEAIPMEPVKEKLRNLKTYMPDREEIFYEFADFLAGRLNPELVPMGFVLATELALYDCQKGIDEFTHEPIARLHGYPPMIYALLRMEIPYIADATCPPEFAQGVREFVTEVNDDMQKKSR